MTAAELQREHKETESQYAGWWAYTSGTLRLPAPVLTKFYSGNARRLLHLPAPAAANPVPPRG